MGRAAGGRHRLAAAVRQRGDVGRPLPTFLELLGPRDGRTGTVLTVLLGLTLIVTTLIGAETALGFAFDPRYRDFPFAALTMAVVPFAR